MSEKCFCHLNGLAVKDATARADIELLRTELNTVKSDVESELNTMKSDAESEMNAMKSEIKCLHGNVVTPQMFGAKGDGVTDDTIAIQNAVNSLGNYGVLYFPAGVYLVSRPSEWQPSIKIDKKSNILICGDNAKIKMATNGFANYCVIKVIDSNNVTIKGLTLEGDRLTHDYTTESGTHEFGYGVWVDATATYGGEMNVNIDNCEIFNMTGDGVVTQNGEGSGVIKITNCNIHHCRRQGVSVLDTDIVQIDNCEIHHIGDHDGINGASPKCGIDVEPTSGSKTVNKVTIKNSKIYDCSSYAMVSAYAEYCNECVVENCEILCSLSFSHTVLFDNCRIGNENTFVSLQSKLATYRNCVMWSGNAVFLGSLAEGCYIYGTSMEAPVRIQRMPLIKCYVENGKVIHNATDILKGAKMTTFHNIDFTGNWTAEGSGSFDMCVFTGEIKKLGGDHAATTFVFNNCYCESKPVHFGVYNGGYVGE